MHNNFIFQLHKLARLYDNYMQMKRVSQRAVGKAFIRCFEHEDLYKSNRLSYSAATLV